MKMAVHKYNERKEKKIRKRREREVDKRECMMNMTSSKGTFKPVSLSFLVFP
jgi:hypothetical protein